MKKNILIISHEFPPVIGGAGSVAETNATLLSLNNNVTVLTKYIKNRERNKSYSIIEVNAPSVIFPIFYYLKLISLFSKIKFDNIIVNDTAAAIICALFFNKSHFSYTSMYFHGSEVEEIINSSRPSIYIIKRLYLNAIRKSRQLVFVSNFLKIKILNVITDNLELIEKSKVVYTLVDPDKFHPKYNTDLFDSLKGKKIVLTVSRVVEKKGLIEVVDLIESLNYVSENKYHWVLIGNGDYVLELKSYLKDKNLNEHFTHIEFIEREKLNEYYSMSDVFILLSNFEESFGLVYLEACLCGTPVIGKNKGGVKEVIKNGVNGYLVNTHEEAIKAIQDIEEISSDSCIEFVNNLYAGHNVKKYTKELLTFPK